MESLPVPTFGDISKNTMFCMPMVQVDIPEFQTPTFPIDKEYVDSGRYTLFMSFVEGDATHEVAKAALNRLDEHLKNAAQERWEEWFGVPAPSEIPIKISSASFAVKVAPGVPVYDPSKAFLGYATSALWAGKEVVALVECTGAAFFGGRVGLGWKATQLMVFPPRNVVCGFTRFSGKCASPLTQT